jgi:hypothetical protein
MQDKGGPIGAIFFKVGDGVEDSQDRHSDVVGHVAAMTVVL